MISFFKEKSPISFHAEFFLPNNLKGRTYFAFFLLFKTKGSEVVSLHLNTPSYPFSIIIFFS